MLVLVENAAIQSGAVIVGFAGIHSVSGNVGGARYGRRRTSEDE
jgi:hypothetical protein